MKQIKVNPNNEKFYSKEFIRGFNLGAERQYEADIEDMPKWIPCSERLPNKDGRYLVCTDWAQDNIDVLRWADGWNCFRDFDGNVYRKSELDRDTIIAWMPLPMALEGEGDD